MKKLAHSILTFLFLFPFIIHAQDWRCVRDTVTAIFVDTMTPKTMWAIKVDSVWLYQGYTYCSSFPVMRFVSRNYHEGTFYTDDCYDAEGASRFGAAMSTGDSGTYFFNYAGDAIRIYTEKQTNQAWICCRITDTTHLEAMVTYAGIDTVLGFADSVKYISFQAKKNSGPNISHPLNTKQFKVSRRFGMLTLFDFYQFPVYDSLKSPVHNLAGIKSQNLITGEQNLTQQEIYSYEKGDVFHSFYSGWSDPHGPSWETLTVNKVLDSALNSTNDTIIYKISRFISDWSGYWFDEHHYSKDTVFNSYAIHSDPCSGIDNYPEQSIFCYNPDGTLKSVNAYTQRRVSYNARRTKSKYNPMTPVSVCADTLVGVSVPALGYTSWTDYYIEGCGGPYYSGSSIDWSHDPHSTFYKLVYFKKGSETWGTPLDTTNWLLSYSVIENEGVKFNIYPNPSGDAVTVEIPGIGKENYRLEIINLTGVKIAEMNFNARKNTFPVSNFMKGMYILNLYKDNQIVGHQKLIKK